MINTKITTNDSDNITFSTPYAVKWLEMTGYKMKNKYIILHIKRFW